MYIPSAFREERPAVLQEIMRRYGFATLVSQGEGGLVASQLPFLLDAGLNLLRSHMALGNPQWRELEGREVMVMFQGPHGYISPTAYETKLAVPTWNYVTVHAYGMARLVDEAALRVIVNDTVEQYEGSREKPWPMELPEEFVGKLLGGIVGFEIAISRVEGKLKLSQNRPAGDVEGAIASSQGELAEWMRRVWEEKTGKEK